MAMVRGYLERLKSLNDDVMAVGSRRYLDDVLCFVKVAAQWEVASTTELMRVDLDTSLLRSWYCCCYCEVPAEKLVIWKVA